MHWPSACKTILVSPVFSMDIINLLNTKNSRKL